MISGTDGRYWMGNEGWFRNWLLSVAPLQAGGCLWCFDVHLLVVICSGCGLSGGAFDAFWNCWQSRLVWALVRSTDHSQLFRSNFAPSVTCDNALSRTWNPYYDIFCKLCLRSKHSSWCILFSGKIRLKVVALSIAAVNYVAALALMMIGTCSRCCSWVPLFFAIVTTLH